MKVLKFFLMLAIVGLVAIGGFHWIVLPKVSDMANEISMAMSVSELKDLQRERDRLEDFVRCLNIIAHSDGVEAERMKTAKWRELDQIDQEISIKKKFIQSQSQKSP